MPQASEELRQKFEDDYQAWIFLENRGFKEDRFLIYHEDKKSREFTQAEHDAIDYLIFEWDWDYAEQHIPITGSAGA